LVFLRLKLTISGTLSEIFDLGRDCLETESLEGFNDWGQKSRRSGDSDLQMID
jgi:hypothetical protein